MPAHGGSVGGRRLELLHANVRKFGTITNAVAAAVQLSGRLVPVA